MSLLSDSNRAGAAHYLVTYPSEIKTINSTDSLTSALRRIYEITDSVQRYFQLPSDEFVNSEAYSATVQGGRPTHRLKTVTGNVVGLQRQAMKYGWKDWISILARSE